MCLLVQPWSVGVDLAGQREWVWCGRLQSWHDLWVGRQAESGPRGSLEIGYCAGRNGKTRPRHWTWEMGGSNQIWLVMEGVCRGGSERLSRLDQTRPQRKKWEIWVDGEIGCSEAGTCGSVVGRVGPGGLLEVTFLCRQQWPAKSASWMLTTGQVWPVQESYVEERVRQIHPDKLWKKICWIPNSKNMMKVNADLLRKIKKAGSGKTVERPLCQQLQKMF